MVENIWDVAMNGVSEKYSLRATNIGSATIAAAMVRMALLMRARTRDHKFTATCCILRH